MLQEALAESAQLSLDTMLDALDAILQEQLWQVGRQFDCFAEFAIGLRPAGLGVRSLPPLKLLALCPAGQRLLRALDRALGTRGTRTRPPAQKARQ